MVAARWADEEALVGSVGEVWRGKSLPSSWQRAA